MKAIKLLPLTLALVAGVAMANPAPAHVVMRPAPAAKPKPLTPAQFAGMKKIILEQQEGNIRIMQSTIPCIKAAPNQEAMGKCGVEAQKQAFTMHQRLQAEAMKVLGVKPPVAHHAVPTKH